MTSFPDDYKSFAACTVVDPSHPQVAGHVMEAKTVAGNKVVFVAFHDHGNTWASFPPSSVVLTGEQCGCGAAGRQRT